jgi:oligosaccharide repeat unit polymerase
MITLCILLFSVSFLIWILSRKIFLPSSAFCGGWAVGITAALYSASQGELPEIGESGQQLISNAMYGAMTGGLISAAWIRFRKGQLHLELTRINEARLAKAMICIFIASLVFALLQWRSFGYPFELSEIRFLHVQQQNSMGIRAANYLGTLIGVFTAIYGYKAVSKGENLMEASIKIWIFQMPLGLITGGRSWLVMPLVFVIFPILFLFSAKQVWRLMSKNLTQILIIFCVFAVAFSYMGYLRLRDNIMGNSITLRESSSSVRNYLGIPVSAVGSYAEVALATGPHYGALSFEFFGKQLSRLGMIDTVDWLYGARQDVSRNLDDRLGSTHSSCIPRFVGDFGVTLLPYITALFILIADWIFFMILRRGLMGYFISLQIWVAAAFAFQEFNPSSGGFWIGIASAYFIAVLFTSEGRFIQKYIPGLRPVLGRPKVADKSIVLATKT